MKTTISRSSRLSLSFAGALEAPALFPSPARSAPARLTSPAGRKKDFHNEGAAD